MAPDLTRVVERRFFGPLAEQIAVIKAGGDIVLYWLGQAGFLFEANGRRLLVDPYLSDTLADKYRGSETPHDRISPPPIDLERLNHIDLVLVTHHHTDHMDPGTLRPLAEANPALRLVVPKASRGEALQRTGVSEDRLMLMDAGDRIEPWLDLSVVALRAAHETLERDEEGHYRFLGYALVFRRAGCADITVIHSGDTIPFGGQAEEVRRLRPSLLLLPVNGRSAELAARGVPGNLTLDEAIALTIDSGAPAMIAHHYGLFAFNTLAPALIERKAQDPGLPIKLLRAREDVEVRVSSP
jgi:L-ascorbate metabolism protein UlaG (beta-lactamase superfamily)